MKIYTLAEISLLFAYKNTPYYWAMNGSSFEEDLLKLHTHGDLDINEKQPFIIYTCREAKTSDPLAVAWTFSWKCLH